jgi:Heterokaryon incompatibility protein (HET)
VQKLSYFMLRHVDNHSAAPHQHSTGLINRLAVQTYFSELFKIYLSYSGKLLDSYLDFKMSALPLNQYTYESLRSHSDIRLLTLLPGNWDDCIRCQLQHTSLDEHPTYEALSYVWGDATKSHKIELGGYELGITRNLHVALQHLQSEHETRVLWIDALCINQSNTMERNQQVRMMGQIFHSAQRVLAWLGEAENESDESMTVVEDIAELCTKIKERGDWDSFSPQLLADFGFETNDKNWTALRHLLHRPYWSRIWIFQEQHFAGSVLTDCFPELLYLTDTSQSDKDRCVVGCGRRWLPRSHFLFVGRFFDALEVKKQAFLRFKQEGSEPLSTHLQEPLQSLHLYHHHSFRHLAYALLFARAGVDIKSKANQLPYLINLTSSFSASDPKDMVFALLGMIRPESTPISIDYRRSVEEILKDVVCFAITEYESLGILEGNRISLVESSCSWLPYPKTYGFDREQWGNPSLFKASNGIPPDQPLRFGQNDRIFSIRGIVIGTVSTLIKPPKYRHEGTSGVSAETFSSLVEYANKLTTDAQRESFWRTLVLDQGGYGHGSHYSRAPEEFRNMFEAIVTTGFGHQSSKPSPSDVKTAEYALPYLRCLTTAMAGRSFFDTDTAYMGIGSYLAQPGDKIAVLIGGSKCFVLRPEGQYFKLIGDAYVYGAMQGEFIKMDEQGNIIDVEEFGLC